MNGIRSASLALLVLSLAAPARAAFKEGASFLTVSPTARATSLAGFLPTETGPDALFHNPGGAGVDKASLSVNYAELFAGTHLNALGLSVPLSARSDLGTLGLSVVTLSHSALEGRDEQDSATGAFKAWEGALGLSYAKALGETSAGGTVKYIRETIAAQSAAGWALDVGLQRRFSSLMVGVTAQNLGPSMKFVSERYALPLSYNLGAAYSLNRFLLLQGTVQARPHDSRTSIGAGMEVSLGHGMAARSGFLNSVNSSASSQTSFISRLGFGLGWKLSRKGLSVDYALSPGASTLGAAHRFSMNLAWGAIGNSARRSENPQGRESRQGLLIIH